jgi:PAS domain S-box-containing protein
MSWNDPATPARPPGAETHVAPAPAAGDATSFLGTRGARTHGEGRRVLVGFGVLLLLCALVLNVWLYQSARANFERDGWARLEASADMRRDQIAYGTEILRREAQNVAEDPAVSRLLEAFTRGSLTPAQWSDLREELRGAQRHFEFENVQLLDADGRVFDELVPAAPARLGDVRRLVGHAIANGKPTFGDPMGDELLIAMPVPAPPGRRGAALVVHMLDNRLFTPSLGPWPGLGESSGAILVRADGSQALVLTSGGGPGGLRAGTRLALQARDVLPVTMAAIGLESRVEATDATGRPIWAVTRSLPSLGWGVVSFAAREDLLAGMRDTSRGMILIDLAILIGLLAIGVVWRRLYTSALASQAVELTERHARRVQAVFDNAFDAIFTFDRSGHVRSANRAAALLFGRPAAELDGEPVGRFLRWGGADAAALPLPGTVGLGEALRPGGARVPVEYSLGTTGGADELLYTAIVRDISERIEAEQRIRDFASGLESSNRRLEELNAQLEEASRLKSEFLANTSHELRTPLNGMIGFLQLVLDDLCDSPEEERDFLRQALQCSRHLLGLINDVLDLAKIEAGKFSLEFEPIDVRRLFDEVQTLTQSQATRKGLRLTFESNLEDDVSGRGDFGKVKQVLVNLVGNGLKFTHEGGVRVRAVSRRTLGHIMFEVVDTGIGIPPSRQKLIFEKFVQADGSTTRRYGGTGLGLAISRSLIEMMGGVIGVQSEGEGRGTRTYFSLPVWRAEGATHPAGPPGHEGDAAVEGPGSGPLVLVVEDDPVFRRFLVTVLQRHGYRTADAVDAEQGWQRTLELLPACVVLDYALSCGDGASLRTGWDLAKRMAGEPGTRHVPIVFVTGFDGELQEKLLATAFARHPGHLVKPIEAAQLIGRIQAMVGDVPGRPLRVLMADDDQSVATYVRKVLPADRFVLQVARDGGECLHALRTAAQPFDLLLLDLMMPEVSGYDVLREMTLSGLCPDMPVLVLTNFPEARNAEEVRLLERGLVVDVLPKTAVHADSRLLPELLERHLRVLPATPAPGGAPGPDLREAA